MPLLIALYLLMLVLIGIYGLHRCWLLYLYRRHRADVPPAPRRIGCDDDLPAVTIQLPMFNEAAVARRVIDATCAIDYPRDRLQIQVLDDSTDHGAHIARRRVDHWAARGVNIQYLHRTDRIGYKAGALQHALAEATGELVAIFDADFVPPRRFLKRTAPCFADPQVGMVQACWSHLNRNDSLLTRAQAIFLDGHFLVEHAARNRSGAWINFNGTAGVWRRAAIEDAGGWQHDTLTEDVDLSYRAQLAGWRFVFLPRLRCPAELPPEINAFRSQQHRWTKGSIQVAMKLLPTLLRAPVPKRVKIEAFFHLTCPMVYLYVTLLALLMYPAMVGLRQWGGHEWIGALVGPIWLMLGTVSALLFYIASQRAQHRSTWTTIAQAPVLMAVGVGIALSNAVGCLEALIRHDSPFVRTPKWGNGPGGQGAEASPAPLPPGAAGGGRLGLRRCFGFRGTHDIVADMRAPLTQPLPPRRGERGKKRLPRLRRWHNAAGARSLGPSLLCLVEITMGLYMLACIYFALTTGLALAALPFLLLFAAGYLYVGVTSAWLVLADAWNTWRARTMAAAPPGVGAAVTPD